MPVLVSKSFLAEDHPNKQVIGRDLCQKMVPITQEVTGTSCTGFKQFLLDSLLKVLHRLTGVIEVRLLDPSAI